MERGVLWESLFPTGTVVHNKGTVVDGGVTATGVLSRERGNLITVCITLY